MHLLEQYSISTGLKIDNPHINTKYFPIPFDKYIVFHLSSKDNLRDYDYWDEVLSIIRPYFTDYKIIQVGIDKDPAIRSDLDLRSKTNLAQLAYVIKNAALFVGVDSFPAHLAGYSRVPMVVLYANSFASCVRPYWGDTSRQRLMETHRPDGEKPSFSFHEDPKTINRIMPQEVADNIFDLMGIKPKQNIESLYFGARYKSVILDFIPNVVINAEFNSQIAPHIRYDYVGEEFESNVYSQIYTRKCAVLTDKPLNVEILKKLKGNIVQIGIMIKDKSLLEFVKQIHFSGVPYVLISYLPEEQLQQIKLTYSDYSPILSQKRRKKDEFYQGDLAMDGSVCFKTNKYLFSGNKCFINKAYWLADKNYDGMSEKPYENLGDLQEEFWQEGDFYYLYKKVDTMPKTLKN